MEFDEDDVGGRVDGLQSRVPAKLANLRRRLVWTVPAEKQRGKHTHIQKACVTKGVLRDLRPINEWTSL